MTGPNSPHPFFFFTQKGRKFYTQIHKLTDPPFSFPVKS